MLAEKAVFKAKVQEEVAKRLSVAEECLNRMIENASIECPQEKVIGEEWLENASIGMGNVLLGIENMMEEEMVNERKRKDGGIMKREEEWITLHRAVEAHLMESLDAKLLRIANVLNTTLERK